MKNSFEWENRPKLESFDEGFGKDIGVLSNVNLAILQLAERRGNLNVAPITSPVDGINFRFTEVHLLLMNNCEFLFTCSFGNYRLMNENIE